MTQSPIHFTLSFSEPQAHYVEVKMDIVGISGSFIDLKMPVWTPGSYLVREYSKNLENFLVTKLDSDQEVKFEKTSKNTWRVYHSDESIQVSYRLYGFEQSVRTNFIDIDHAFISPAATFMYIDGQKNLSSTIEIIPDSRWSEISTGLPLVDTHTYTYFAQDADILFDSPIEIGNQDIWVFTVDDIPHEFAMVGGGDYDCERITKDVSKIIQSANAIWGHNPNDRYVFITHNYQSAYGGLEHLNSTVLAFSRNGYSNPSQYKNYLGLVAHEYFHLWCVKRLRPIELGPFNYDSENYSHALWIMEGFTSYYDNLITRRANIRDEEDYLKMLAIDFNTVYARPGVQVQSAELASFDTWIKHYRPDENSINTSISYYNKGAMLACAMDLKIIAATQGKIRLDDVLRAAYDYFYVQLNRGFEIDELQKLAQEVTQVDLSDIFTAAGTCEELDYNTLFHQVGYTLENTGTSKISLGITTSQIDQRVIIKTIKRHSAAWDSGLNVNDEIIAINEERIDPAGKEIETLLQQALPNHIWHILISRDGLIRTIQVKLQEDTTPNYIIKRRDDASEREQALGAIWLSL